MGATRERNRGLVLIAAGIAAVVLGVLLFGLTTPAGAIDWMSVVTAVAGLVITVEGLYLVYRNKGTGGSPAGGTQPRGGS